MRMVVVVGLGGAVASATPAPRAIVASMVRLHLTAVGTDHWRADELGLPDDVLIYAPLGSRGAYGSDGDMVRGPGMAFWHDVVLADSVAINRVDVVVAGDVAWLQADYRFDGKGGPGTLPDTHDPQHAAGIALHGPSGWRLQAMGYGELVSDHDLVTLQPRFNSDKLPNDPPKLSGDAELAKAVASWIATGFTGHGATAGTLASGSAPGEIASDADVAKLVKGWDALGLRASAIEATVLRGSNAGFVHAEVAFPIKSSKRAAPLHLNLGAIREADGWRWAVLAYGAPSLM